MLRQSVASGAKPRGESVVAPSRPVRIGGPTVVRRMHTPSGVSSPVITLVAPNDRSRVAVARYLERAGFDVCHQTSADAATTLVWLTAAQSDTSDAADAVTAWLAGNTARRAIVVTPRPAAFRALREGHRRRLVVLPAPAFGWQIVDALWATRRMT